MKKLFLLLALGAMVLPIFAQTDSDTTEITVGKKRIIVLSDPESEETIIVGDTEMTTGDDRKKKRKAVDVDVIGFDLGMNFLMDDGQFGVSTANSALETKPVGSTNFGIHLFPTEINLIRNKVNLKTAVTFDNNRYSFRDNIIVVPDQPTLTLIEDSSDYRKSKLISWYAQVPLMLNFQTSPDNHSRNFHLSVGGYAGLLLSGRTKRKGDEIGKIKQQDDYNLNPFRYGLTGRIGYNNVEFYCNYNLTSMFDEDQGPEIIPVTFGISLTGML